MNAGRTLICAHALTGLLLMSEGLLAQALPTIAQCSRGWVLTTVQELNYGAFSVEAGTATITMDSLGALTTSGLVDVSSAIPATTWIIDVTNTRDTGCATYGFDLESLADPPAPLRGPGTNIPHNNVRFSAPAYSLSDATFPQTIAPDPGNTAPFTIVVYGEIMPTFPQTAGEYDRRLVTLIAQDGRRRRVRIDVRATSIVPLSVTELTPMSFGTVAGGPAPGTAVLGFDNSRLATGDAQLLAAGPGTAASYQLTGESSLTYSVSFSDGTLANVGGQLMTVTTFTHNGSGIVPAAGVETFQVGATLNIGPNQPAGTYSTSIGGGSPFTITINYN